MTDPADSMHWPELPLLAAWEDTVSTLHMWSQVVGKVALALAPPLNHSWGSALQLDSRGLITRPLPCPGGTLTIAFNFLDHRLEALHSSGRTAAFALEPMTVAAFHERCFALLGWLGLKIAIYDRPVEVVEAIPFTRNTQQRSYERDSVRSLWLALLASSRVMERFRGEFLGKCSPVHFFWGAFDLAVTRFSGRTAPRHPGGVPNCPDRVMHDAYSHELSSAGFWPGAGLGEAAFYSYAYPEPDGFRQRMIAAEGAYFHEQLGEFILPYAVVRQSPDPAAALLAFLRSTYVAAAELGNWDRAALERRQA